MESNQDKSLKIYLKISSIILTLFQFNIVTHAQNPTFEPELLTKKCSLSCRFLNEDEKKEALARTLMQGQCVADFEADQKKFPGTELFFFKLNDSSITDYYTESFIGANQFSRYHKSCHSSLDPNKSTINTLEFDKTIPNGEMPADLASNISLRIGYSEGFISYIPPQESLKAAWPEIKDELISQLRICEINRVSTSRIYRKNRAGDYYTEIKTLKEELFRQFDDSGSYSYRDVYIHGPNIVDIDLPSSGKEHLDGFHLRAYGDYLSPRSQPGSVDAIAQAELAKLKLQEKCN